MEPRRSGLLVLNVVCWLLVLWACKWPSKIKRHLKTNTGQLEPIKKITTVRELSGNELPVCSGNLLDQREYHYENEKLGPFDSRQMMSKTGPCRLLEYTVERAVACLDAIREGSSGKKLLHLVFIGDSRMRQQFNNFLRLIPDHDRKSLPSPIPPVYHGDVEVTSEMLRLRLSFQWRPLLDGNVTETIRKWASPNDNEPPYLIFLSMVLWHIVRIHSNDEYRIYEENLKVISPMLSQLANNTQVIWLNQYPMLTFYEGMPYGGVKNVDIILSEKAHRYNEAIRGILGNGHRGVRIWDSSNPLVEEYVRGCVLIQRGHPGSPLFKDPDHSYLDCKDYIHTGYSALSIATQILFNDICKTKVYPNQQ